jgi:PQQ-dependent dehydrogenase (methanol/ethanol family)
VISRRIVRKVSATLAAGALVLTARTPVPAEEVPAHGLFAGDRAAQFTADAAARGRTAYARSCLSCHGATLEGNQLGPPLTGDVFQSHWRGHSHAEFARKLRTTMPPGGAGSLSGAAYADVEAYILEANANARGPSGASGASPAIEARASNSQRAGGAAAAQMFAGLPGQGKDPLYLAALKMREQKLASITPVTDAMLHRPPASDWLMWRRTYEAQGFSPLRQIDRSNVARLRTAWTWSLPQSTNEITPLVHDGVMFIYSGAAVQALDAASGELLWQYLRTLPDEFDNGRRGHAKAIAVRGDELFVPTADGHLIALDVHTGRLVWDHEVVARDGRPAALGLQLTGGPIVAKDTVIIGVSLGTQDRGGCYIVGLDAQSGAERWRFYTIARPGEPGGDTWNGAPVPERFGAGVWTVGSYDPELDLVYFGIGNTYDTATLLEPRPGAERVTNNDALYTDSTVALQPETGKLVWYFQHQKRDVWDLDWVFEQSIVTLNINGRPRKVVVTGGKTALFDAVDAATGVFVFSADAGLQNVVTAVDPVTGAKTVNPAVEPEAGKAKYLCPNSFGARNWPATSLNPVTDILYVPILENCAEYTYAPRGAAQTAQGGLDMRFALRAPPQHDGRFGRITALDLRNRRVRWTHRQRMPIAGSTLATAGGLLFNGDVDRYFYAFDQATGEVLWHTRLDAAPESSPVTFTANGRQYVAVVAGSGSPFGSGSRIFVPEVRPAAPGVTLVVFGMPED